MVSLTSRVEPCHLQEVKALLLSYENRLETVEQTSLGIDGSIPSANVAQTQQNDNGNRGHRNGNRGGGRGNNNRGRGGHNGNFKPRCQICPKHNHTADHCYERYNANYVPDTGNRQGNGDNQRNPGYVNNNGAPRNYNGGQQPSFGSHPSVNVANMGGAQGDGYSDIRT